MLNVELENELIEFKARLEFKQEELLRMVHEINILHVSKVVTVLTTADLLRESLEELEQILEKYK
ncbi:hypothetical protein [Pedobacter sp. B4-66]|uniref:hypothetical protein n=1 Tax=Pedobacter sp. B4-66 TaxID=2817280 RepID=UPI001BDA937B|nr:hypothetical protein [Pedobacter sp. B4-66]